MPGLLRIDPADAAPIWRQIEEGIAHLVGSGALVPAAPVPSVRDLARDLGVNPATVAKAYQRLADAGVLTVKRGDGTYVAERPPRLTRGQRGRLLGEAAARYAAMAANVGAPADEALGEVKTALARFTRGEGGGNR